MDDDPFGHLRRGNAEAGYNIELPRHPRHVREYGSYQEAKANVGPGEVVVAWAPTPTDQRYGVGPLTVGGQSIGVFLTSYFDAVEREARRMVSA